VCIPGLHISLGIFDRLWELLEDACNELDITIIKHEHQTTTGEDFGVYITALNNAQQLREKIKIQHQHAAVLGDLVTYLMLHLPNAASDPILKQAQREVTDHNRTITTTVGNIN
jgi:hypothetical protein